MDLQVLRESLATLLAWHAWELYKLTGEDGTTGIRIPYMMNDAVECFLQFDDCIIRGEWDPSSDVISCEIPDTGENSRMGLILRQENNNFVTIWFRKFSRPLHCYQYHRIGHRWRKTLTEERARRMVNLLCVIHDKVSLLRNEGYTPQEEALSRLIECGPVCYFTPINESIEHWYKESPEGIAAAIALAEETGDEKLKNLFLRYPESADAANLRTRWKKKAIRRQLIKALSQPAHQSFWLALESHIRETSLHWPARTYPEPYEQEIQAKRQAADAAYGPDGWFEEQPFTVMESPDYKFRIYNYTNP